MTSFIKLCKKRVNNGALNFILLTELYEVAHRAASQGIKIYVQNRFVKKVNLSMWKIIAACMEIRLKFQAESFSAVKFMKS